LICCAVAADRMAGRAHRYAARAFRPCSCHGIVRNTPFLGAIAWELLAAPNSGLLNHASGDPGARKTTICSTSIPFRD